MSETREEGHTSTKHSTNMKTAKLRLTIEVEYTLNGASIQELKENLAAGAEYLAGIGMFTQDTEAEVETWDEEVVEMPSEPDAA